MPGRQLTLPFGQPAQRPHPARSQRLQPAQSPMDRLFFAVVPDEAARGRIAALLAQLREEHALAGTPIAPGCLHVSLCGIDAHAASALEQAAGAMPMHPFPVTFDRVLSFGGSGNRPLVALGGGDCPAALMALRTAVGAEMAKAGLGRRLWPGFTPHLTLLYGRSQIPARAIDAIGWTVREVVLVRSLYGRGRHRHLLRWPLRRLAD